MKLVDFKVFLVPFFEKNRRKSKQLFGHNEIFSKQLGFNSSNLFFLFGSWPPKFTKETCHVQFISSCFFPCVFLFCLQRIKKVEVMTGPFFSQCLVMSKTSFVIFFAFSHSTEICFQVIRFEAKLLMLPFLLGYVRSGVR